MSPAVIASRPTWLAAALGCAAVLGTRAAIADPVTFAAQPPLPAGAILVTQRASWTVATDGPAPENADDTALLFTTVVALAPHQRLTIAAMLDYVRRTAELSSAQGDRVERRATGIGDTTLLLSSSFTRSLAIGKRAGRVVGSPVVGIKLPTGSDDRVDQFGRLPQRLQVGTGAIDVVAGGLASWTGRHAAVHGAVTYTRATQANEFKAGDAVRGELAGHVCLPRLCGQGSIDVWAGAETRLTWRAADRGRLAPADSGGTSWYAAPGVQARMGRHTFEAALEIPLVQPFDQHVDMVVRGGYRILVR